MLRPSRHTLAYPLEIRNFVHCLTIREPKPGCGLVLFKPFLGQPCMLFDLAELTCYSPGRSYFRRARIDPRVPPFYSMALNSVAKFCIGSFEFPPDDVFVISKGNNLLEFFTGIYEYGNRAKTSIISSWVDSPSLTALSVTGPKYFQLQFSTVLQCQYSMAAGKYEIPHLNVKILTTTTAKYSNETKLI